MGLGEVGGINMIHEVELPALDGRSPLGFLAGLGVLNILDSRSSERVGLSFSPDSGAVLIHSKYESADSLAAELCEMVASAPDGTSIVGMAPGFPLRPGRNSDPMRRPREDYRELQHEIGQIDQMAASHWLPCLFTDLAVDREGRAELTPFQAPSGKQSVHSFFSKPFEAVRHDPVRIREALVGWHRVAGFTGEYLDHHVLNSKADDVIGTGEERGVPGATWLATMALPMLRVTGDGRNVKATLWHRSRSRYVMLWPLWRERLDTSAIRVLLEHSSLVPIDDKPTVARRDWQMLGIFTVCGAERQRVPGRKFAGVLAPCAVHTRWDAKQDNEQHD
jgi:hypothetical protein